MRRASLAGATAAALACGVTAGATPALGANGWNAKRVGQSKDLTLESGQIANAWFRARNIGQRTWASSTVSLGTSSPHDRDSAFFVRGRWLAKHRPTRLKEPSVVPGELGTFSFVVKAPEVSARREFREHFAPVADIPDGGWMETDGEWENVSIVYTVQPRKAPTVRFASAPQTARQGEPIDVVAEAADDFAMKHVELFVDGQPAATVASDGTGRFAASIPSDGIAPGPHQLLARAVDHVGNQTDVTHAFEVQAPPPEQAGPPPPPPPPPPVAAPLDADAVLKARLLRRGRLRVLAVTVRAPAGTRVVASCPRRRCRSQVIASTRRRSTTLYRLRGRVLRRGTRLEIRFTKPGTRGVMTRFTVGRRTVRKTRVRLPG